MNGDRVICLVGGEPDAKGIAFEKYTGEVLRRALSSDWEPGYSAPLLIEAAGAPQLVIRHPRAISALNPETGAPHVRIRRLDQGDQIRDPAQWATAFFVRHGDRYFINTDGGDLVIARFLPAGYEEISRTRTQR